MLIFLAALGLSVALNIILKKFNIEVILGYLFSGAIIGAVFHLSEGSELGSSFGLFAELGIALLMFTIGLEFSSDKIKAMKKEVFVYGSVQMLLTTIVFFSIAFFGFGLSSLTSAVIGLGLSLSSTAIVLKLLNETKTLHKIYGKNSVGILLLQDIAVIPILLFISIAGSEDASAWDIFVNTIIDIVILSILFFVGGRYLVTPFLRFVSETKSDEIFIAAILFLVLGFAELAYIFDLSYSLGAFVAGLILSKTPYKYQIESDLIPFRDLLLGIFFLSVGMQIHLPTIMEYWLIILAVLLGVILIKAALLFAIMRSEYTHQTSIKTAITLAQVGEFSFVVFGLALENNLFVDETVSNILMSAIILSMLVTPLIFNNLQRISMCFFPTTEDDIDTVLKGHEFKNHIIVCGYGSLGQKVVEKLERRNIEYVGIERDHTLINAAQNNAHRIIMGNSAKKSILKKIGVAEASAVVIAIPNPQKMMRILHAVIGVNSQVPIIVRASRPHQKVLLEDIQNVEIIDELKENTDAVMKFLKKVEKNTNT